MPVRKWNATKELDNLTIEIGRAKLVPERTGIVLAWIAKHIKDHDGSVDNTLPDPENPTDPDYGVEEGSPDNSLPGRQPRPPRPDQGLPSGGRPVDPGYGVGEGTPDNSLPGTGGRPDNSLPGSPAAPGNELPGAPEKPEQGLPDRGGPGMPGAGGPGTPGRPGIVDPDYGVGVGQGGQPGEGRPPQPAQPIAGVGAGRPQHPIHNPDEPTQGLPGSGRPGHKPGGGGHHPNHDLPQFLTEHAKEIIAAIVKDTACDPNKPQPKR